MKNIVQIILLVFLPFIGLSQNEPVNEKSEPFNAEKVYTMVDEMPQFPEGEMGLIKFYQESSDHPVVGKNEDAAVVYYQIVIDEKGSPTEFKILRGQSDRLNEITENIINKMPQWTPGKQNGQPVKVVKNLSIRFATLD